MDKPFAMAFMRPVNIGPHKVVDMARINGSKQAHKEAIEDYDALVVRNTRLCNAVLPLTLVLQLDATIEDKAEGHRLNKPHLWLRLRDQTDESLVYCSSVVGQIDYRLKSDMSDPFSILTGVSSLAKATYSVATTLYSFVNGVRNIDRSVQDLHNEVTALNQAVKAVRTCLKQPSLTIADKASGGNMGDFWKSIRGCLKRCQLTVSRLGEALVSVKKPRSNLVTQTVRTVKFNMKAEEIAEFRSQIQAHILSFQLQLQAINVYISSSIPAQITTELEANIDKLQKMIQTVQNANTNPSLQGLTTSAAKVLSNASNVWGSTEGGSIQGSPLQPGVEARINEWISPANVSETTLPFRMSLARPKNPSISTETDSPSTTLADEQHFSETESDGEDEFKHKFIIQCLERAEELYTKADFATAIEFFQRALSDAANVSAKRRESLIMQEVMFKIGTCFINQNWLSEAEGVFLELTDIDPSNVQDKALVLSATHNLAEIAFQNQEYEKADSLCRKALNGRRRLDKDGRAYFESVALLSIICEGKGDLVEASTLIRMIPESAAVDGVTKARKLRDIKFNAHNSPRPVSTSPPANKELPFVIPRTEMRDSRGFSNLKSFQDPQSNFSKLSFPVLGGETKTFSARKLEGHSAYIWDLKFSPDGSQLASISYDETIRLWDVDTGGSLQCFSVHNASRAKIAFSSDGRQLALASGSHNQTVQLWDISTGITWSLGHGEENKVNDVAFSPDGRNIASISDEMICLRDLGTCKILQKVECKGRNIAIAFSPDGTKLASISNHKVQLWDAAIKLLHTFEVGDKYLAIAFSPDGGRLAAASIHHTTRIWDVRTCKISQTFESQHRGFPYGRAIAFSADGRQLAVAAGQSVEIWDFSLGRILTAVSSNNWSMILAVAFSPTGCYLATPLHKKIVLWEPGK